MDLREREETLFSSSSLSDWASSTSDRLVIGLIKVGFLDMSRAGSSLSTERAELLVLGELEVS
jgi:hypothetical protein